MNTVEKEKRIQERLKTFKLPMALLFESLEKGRRLKDIQEKQGTLALGDTPIARITLKTENQKSSFHIDHVLETMDLELLKNIEVPLSLEFQPRVLTLSEWEGIEPGDVIESGQSSSERLSCISGNTLIGSGRLLLIEENFGLLLSSQEPVPKNFVRSSFHSFVPCAQARFILAETRISLYDLFSLEEDTVIDFKTPTIRPLRIQYGESRLPASVFVNDKDKICFRIIKEVFSEERGKTEPSGRGKQSSAQTVSAMQELAARMDGIEEQMAIAAKDNENLMATLSRITEKYEALEEQLTIPEEGIPPEHREIEWRIENRDDLIKFAECKPRELLQIFRSMCPFTHEYIEKVLALLLLLPDSAASEVIKYANESEREILLWEIARVEYIDDDIVNDSLKEAHGYIGRTSVPGGIDRARHIFEKAFGTQTTIDMINKLTSSLKEPEKVKPFDFIRRAEHSAISNLLQKEHPQTIALILSYLDPGKSAMLISDLPENLQAEVVKRIAAMGATTPNTVREVERVLDKMLSSSGKDVDISAGGIERAVEILNLLDREIEMKVMDSLKKSDKKFYSSLKDRMFVFEDVFHIEDRYLKMIFENVEDIDIAQALKAVSEEIQYKIFKILDEERSEKIQMDMERMGGVRRIDVEESQHEIINIIHHFEKNGKITI